MNAPTHPLPPRQTANPAPPRPPGSIRRTSSIDVSWPDGFAGERLFIGAARDHRTPTGGGPGETLAEARFEARIDGEKTITAISADPAPPRIAELVGVRAGNHLRVFLREVMPELVAEASPLYLPLDDLSGTALVSMFAWSQWVPDWGARMRQNMEQADLDRLLESRINVCWGLAEGNSGVTGPFNQNAVAEADAGDLRNPADPAGWHPLTDPEDGPGFRRARRIDLWRDGDVIRVAAAFQDSARRPDGGRVAIHEYDLDVVVDAATLAVRALTPHPRILPFHECPGAVANTQRLVGRQIGEMRDHVLELLRGTQGCTHLNDALRALADVPSLVARL